MAKDAKGHGSEARSGHEHAIAKDTVKNPLKGLFLGGPNANQAEATLRGKFGYNDDEISKLKGGGDPRYEDIVSKSPSLGGSQLGGGQPVASNAHAAATLSNGGAKSAPVPVHGGAAGRYDYLTAGAATVKTGPPAPRAQGSLDSRLGFRTISGRPVSTGPLDFRDDKDRG